MGPYVSRSFSNGTAVVDRSNTAPERMEWRSRSAWPWMANRTPLPTPIFARADWRASSGVGVPIRPVRARGSMEVAHRSSALSKVCTRIADHRLARSRRSQILFTSSTVDAGKTSSRSIDSLRVALSSFSIVQNRRCCVLAISPVMFPDGTPRTVPGSSG